MFLKSLLLSVSLSVFTLALCAEGNQTIRQEVDRFYAEGKQAGAKVEIRFCFPEKNGLTQVDVLVSQADDGTYTVRNRLEQIFFRDNKIEAVKRASTESTDFWSAVLSATRILRIKSEDQGKSLRFFDVKSGEEVLEQKFPEQYRSSVQKSGSYLWPQPGSFRPLPEFPLELLDQFRTLSPQQESKWLQTQLAIRSDSAQKIGLLERLAAIGEFHYPMSASDRERWKEFLLNEEFGIAPRRSLQSCLFEANFLAQPEFATELLKDPLLGEETARLYSERNRVGFETLMAEWGNDPELREAALKHSEWMAENALYRQQMLKAFRSPNTEQQKFLIPVYAEEFRAQGSKELQQMLASINFSANFQQLHLLAEWILRTNPKPYAPQIKQLLRRERKSPDLERSVVYPLLLASLCRARDQDGIEKSISYLEALKDQAKIENAKRIWGNSTTGVVTRERLINELKKLQK